MYDDCLFCGAPFRPNRVLANLPLARRVAYDPERGRLWMICSRCRHWSLVPIECRWEALEELEALRGSTPTSAVARDMARFRHGRLVALRLGTPSRRDEVWWRYGRDLRLRRYLRGPIALGLAAGGTALVTVLVRGGVLAAAGAFYAAAFVLPALAQVPRILSYGFSAWGGDLECRKCGTRRTTIRYSEFNRAEVRAGAGGGVALWFPCRRCSRRTLKLDGPEAQSLLRRGLAHRHFFGTTRRKLDAAVALIEDAGSAYSFLLRLAQRNEKVRDLEHVELLALEIAATEKVEADRLAQALDAKRDTWSEEEELASIIDQELTPTPELRQPPNREGS